MNCKNQEDVMKLIREKKVSFIHFWFTDILGRLKNFAVTVSELEKAFNIGVGFDGSSIEGFARIDESDMIAKPDPSTFQIVPWRPSDRPVGRMFCDILETDGSPYPGDPRYAFKRLLKKLLGDEYTYMVGSEHEYYYFKDNVSPDPIDSAGFFDTRPMDMATDLRRDSIFALQDMDIRVSHSQHESSPGQNRIDLSYCEGLKMADAIMAFRIVVKEIAHRGGVYATFMPKPALALNGSGMHVYQSLFKDGKNIFFDPSDPNNLSDIAKNFIAGLLYHAREIMAVTNQWVNSYKRLVPGSGAPVDVTWSRRSRSSLIRVPDNLPGEEDSLRIEYRAPDSACNPYLAFSLMLAAGMKGVDKKWPLKDPVDNDVLSGDDQAGSRPLPDSLYEATEELAKSTLAKEALGEDIFNTFIENKKIEWQRYRTEVSQFEVEQYLPTL